MNKKILAVFCAVVLVLIIGTVFVYVDCFRFFGPPKGRFGGPDTGFDREINYNMLKEALNLSEEATKEEVLDALGVTADATQEQIREAMKEKEIILKWRD